MAETTYTSVTWTAGDVLTEAKLDNMVANDQAVDAMAQGIRFDERTAPADGDVSADEVFLYAKDASTLYIKDDSDTEYQITKDIEYLTAQNTTTNSGNLGATETFDFNSNTFYRGTLDNDVTITISNLTDGQRGQIVLYYDGTSQRTITWSGIDVWIGGIEPSAPDTTDEPLVVTIINDGNLTIASGDIAS